MTRSQPGSPDAAVAPAGAAPAPAATPAPAAPPSPPASPPLAPRLEGWRGTFAWGVVRAVRPRQWAKNVLVLAAPLAAGKVFDVDVLGPTAAAFLLFCVAASGVYLVNDTIDVDEDRRHPRKRFRPIAAGIVPKSLALSMAAVFFVAALVIAVLLTRPALAWVLGSYVVIQLGYCLFLKNQPVIDLAVVASGFLLRGIAGGVAAGLELSQWFLLVAAFGSLFMVAGKRYSELVLIGDAAATRKTLQEYSGSYLRFVWSLSAAVTLTAYSLWAFEMGETQDGAPWSLISIAPFVLAILLYARDVDKGEAGAPEDIVLGDRVLLALGVIWAATMALGVYGV
ncbi:decaprenyl-phosphate phosphoribosyltransferase [Trujillonella endophytica]|uniref:Decaprenyl-phosphate phosphoribosyltransferase n=1 Tax=Trujillonella endophytica TaxID=673521 RepID=A0A1H8RWA8_9ACTN|nr:decaprenyl-phosphate phosphoribosyltransferase [Trujillella endophytica]